MSIRTWEAMPSAQLEDGTPIVTQEDLAKAVMDGVILLDRGGGVLGVVLKRVPSGIPNGMFTTRAVVTWQDRTNARPQPERNLGPELAVEDAVEDAVDSALESPADGEVVGEPALDELHDPTAVDESDVPPALRTG